MASVFQVLLLSQIFVNGLHANFNKAMKSGHVQGALHNNDQLKREESDGQCVYTFLVQHGGQNTCPHGSVAASDKDALGELESLISTQHENILNKLTNLSELIQVLGAKDVEVPYDDNNVTNTTVGTHYTRWGNSNCRQGAETLYNGYIGKSYYRHGGGSNYLCLPVDPEWPEQVQSGHQSQSYVYGVEYEVAGSPLAPGGRHDNDAPCAVCHVLGRSEQIMIPAKRTCPSGWSEEYHGLLMSQHHKQGAATFICVDSEMEVRDGGSSGQDGGLLYFVEAVCGSLPCPPYIGGYELTCVVCSR